MPATIHKSLRSSRIDYSQGRFFVTSQVAHNQSVFGAVAEERMHHSPFGEYMQGLLTRVPEQFPHVALESFVVMPNHVHAMLFIQPRPQNIRAELGRIVQWFKGNASREYGLWKTAGKIPDIGESLWMKSYYDRKLFDDSAARAVRRYIEDNPSEWEGDRFGPMTAYARGNLELLGVELAAFVASDLPFEGASSFRCLRAAQTGSGSGRPVITSGTSAAERFVLDRCLRQGRPFVWVMPGGVPPEMPAPWEQAFAGGRGLAVSPVPPGTGVNKTRAIACNAYILRTASEVWAGPIRPGGSLETLLGARLKPRLQNGG